MNKENILFVIEGESREMDIVKNICNVFFKNTQIKIIPIPAGENIYMLWKKLKEDEFETDLLELLKENKAIDSSEIDNMQRDDFSEVYLFFDYDGHQDNLSNKDEDEKLGNVSYDRTGLVLADSNRSVSVASATSSTQYYVYVGSTVTLATDDLISAITSSDENMGIVLDNTPKYIWKRGRKSYQNAITGIAVGSSDSEASGSARALSAMLVQAGENVQVHTLLESGETPISSAFTAARRCRGSLQRP